MCCIQKFWKKVGKTSLKNCFLDPISTEKGSLWATPKMEKNLFLAEKTKADHQLSESFYFIKISCFDWVMDLFLSWVNFSVKKESFPKITIINLIASKTLPDCINSKLAFFFQFLIIMLLIAGTKNHFGICTSSSSSW